MGEENIKIRNEKLSVRLLTSIENMIIYEPKTALGEGINKIAGYYKNNPQVRC